MKDSLLRLVVLISGSGSNLQAIIDRAGKGLPVEICAVISNRADAYGLQRAAKANIETRVLDHKAFPDRASYDAALADLVLSFQPGLVILAGFMRILTPIFVNRFLGYMFNIHPSLLPKYPGLHTHQRALNEGEKIHGATVHFVTEELDGGPSVLQARVPVKSGDDANSLAARVLAKEHIIYPRVIGWYAEGRLKLEGDRVVKDGIVLDKPLILNNVV